MCFASFVHLISPTFSCCHDERECFIDIQSSKEQPEVLEEQRTIIKNLYEEKKESSRKFEKLMKAIEELGIPNETDKTRQFAKAKHRR